MESILRSTSDNSEAGGTEALGGKSCVVPGEQDPRRGGGTVAPVVAAALARRFGHEAGLQISPAAPTAPKQSCFYNPPLSKVTVTATGKKKKLKKISL